MTNEALAPFDDLQAKYGADKVRRIPMGVRGGMGLRRMEDVRYMMAVFGDAIGGPEDAAMMVMEEFSGDDCGCGLGITDIEGGMLLCWECEERAELNVMRIQILAEYLSRLSMEERRAAYARFIQREEDKHRRTIELPRLLFASGGEMGEDNRYQGLGAKHECFECGAKFYDMNKPELLCPKCGMDQSVLMGDNWA